MCRRSVVAYSYELLVKWFFCHPERIKDLNLLEIQVSSLRSEWPARQKVTWAGGSYVRGKTRSFLLIVI